MKTLFLILLLTIPVLPCGVPSDVHGKIEAHSFSYVILHPVDDPNLYQVRFLSPFGYYRFEDVASCVTYQLSVASKQAYDSPVFLVDSEDVEINLEPQ